MRATLLGLVLLNALYWAWGRWIDTPPTATVSSEASADLPTLQLISEVAGTEFDTSQGDELNLEDVEPLIVMDAGAAGSNRVGVSARAASNTGTSDTVASDSDASDAEPSISGSAVSGSLVSGPPVSGQPFPESQDPGLSDPGSSNPSSSNQGAPDAERSAASASQSEASGRAATGVAATVPGAVLPDNATATAGLLPAEGSVEVPTQQDTEATGNQPLLVNSVVTSGDPIANPSRCESVGPFLSLRQARAAVALLNRAGVATQQRVEEAEVWVGHWVHLPPYPTREAAVAVVERLRREGVKDIYIETTEELRNAVSLGLFSDIEGAEIRAGKVRKLDVRPQIVDRRREGLVYWVDLELRAGSSIDVAMFDVLPHQTLRVEAVTCTGRLNARQ